MTLNELMDFARWLTEDADYEVNDACNCHPEYHTCPRLVESETARWWREQGKGNEG